MQDVESRLARILSSVGSDNGGGGGVEESVAWLMYV